MSPPLNRQAEAPHGSTLAPQPGPGLQPALIASALYVLTDILLFGHRQKMWIMEVVWPLTLLYWGPLGLPFYWRIARRSGEGSTWQYAFAGSSHCGAGCALGDVTGDWLVFLTGFTLLGAEFGTRLLVGFVLAYLFGIAFQYFSVAPMRHLGLREGLWAAIRTDTVSLLAYQVGMFGFMALRNGSYQDYSQRTGATGSSCRSPCCWASPPSIR
jgi:Domain of unknown function (DUF4396)